MSTLENNKPVKYVIVATLRSVIAITDVHDAITDTNHTKYNTAEDASTAMSKGFYDDSDYAVFDTNGNRVQYQQELQMNDTQYITPEELVKITEFPHIAMDKDDCWYAYKTSPKTNNDAWYSNTGHWKISGINVEYDGDWKDSLRSRIQAPKYRPLETEAELAGLTGKALKEKNDNKLITYEVVNKVEIREDETKIRIGPISYSPEGILELFAYTDGSPVGVKEQ